MTVPALAVSTLISEDLRAVPGPALDNALARLRRDPADPQAHLDACLAALLAGEPKRALRLLAEERQTPRMTAALTAWARLIDGNRYPGGIGGESAGDVVGVGVTPSPGTPIEMLVEHIGAYGPPMLSSVRTLLEMSLRAGNAGGVRQAVAAGTAGLQRLAELAAGLGYSSIVQWAALAGADLFRRGGLPEWEPWLAQSRALSAEPAQLALTLLVEGDWYATPGSSPEALGWDLAAQSAPNPLGPPDLASAAQRWAEAVRLLTDPSVTPPALAAALALRRSFLARASEDHATRRAELDAAMAGYRAAGDGSGIQLTAIHEVVAAIDRADLGSLALELGGGWARPEQGPVAEVVEWADTVGSRTWCVGLGRLLERTGAAWTAAGSAPRARVAYLGALALTSIDPTFPGRTLVTAVAAADSRSNLSTHALLRLQRGLGDLFVSLDDADLFVFPQDLEAGFVTIGALRARSRGPGARLAADQFDRHRSRLGAAVDALRARLPAGDVALPTTPAELQAFMAAQETGDSLQSQAEAAGRAVELMRRMQLSAAEDQLDAIDVLGPLCRASAARLAGRDDEAQLWSNAAVEAARKPGIAGYLLPLALVDARRLDEARAALAAGRAAGTIPDEFALPIALRAEDQDAAADALQSLIASGTPPSGWSDLLSQAEVALRAGDAAEAHRTIERAIADLEASVGLLLRDPERVDACDQPDVAALYSTLALTVLRGEAAGGAEASIDAAERLRHLTAADAGSAAAPDGGSAWRLAAASYSAVANRIVALLPTASDADIQGEFAELDRLDHDLAAAELSLDAASPGILVRRADPTHPPAIADVRARMPEGAVLLDYLAVGDDLLAWAVTRDGVRAHAARIHTRELTALVRAFHGGCSAGRAPDSALSELLLTPFADLLRSHPRVVVVPYGPLSLVPFHALRIDGAPLAVSHTVSYAVRAASAFAEGVDDPANRTRPLVIGDPAFDATARPGLQRLPGSLAEALSVAQLLEVREPLVDAGASEAAVAAQLDDADLLHVSSHGHLDELSPFGSSLVLAGLDELTVADLTGMRFETDLAVLTGCDTGRGAATLGGDLVGLTRALLRSGVRRAIVSLWPVDDVVAPVLMRAFYGAIVADVPPAEALATAQRALMAMPFEVLRAEYADLGGVPDSARGTRRGVPASGAPPELDPELIDDEEVPEPLGGDAERYWAPFILVN